MSANALKLLDCFEEWAKSNLAENYIGKWNTGAVKEWLRGRMALPITDLVVQDDGENVFTDAAGGALRVMQLIPPNGLAGKTWGVICVFVTRDGSAMYVKGVKGTDFEKAWKNSAFDVGYHGGGVLDAMRACRKPEVPFSHRS